MDYIFNGKKIKIPDKDIEQSMKTYELSKEEAIQLWLEDEGYMDNDEVEMLTEQAKTVMRTVHDASSVKSEKKEKKPRTVKISDEKHALFTDLVEFLTEKYGENVQIKTENKLIGIKINEKEFKLDLIETRVKK